MNKFLSLCAVSGLFLLGNGCSDFIVPCSQVHPADSEQCNPQDFPLVASQPILSLQGGQLTISIPDGQAPANFNFKSADNFSVSLLQFLPDGGAIGFGSNKYPTIITDLRTTDFDINLTADQLKMFSAGSLRIRVYASGKWAYVDVRLQ